MAKKLDSIVELAAQKTREISANSGNYMVFLTTAAHNFKYDFRDQLLIYAQKPYALPISSPSLRVMRVISVRTAFP